MHLSNSKVALLVVAVVAMIVLVSFVIPPSVEKTECEASGGQWDSGFDACGFAPQACKDAGGTPREINDECGESELCTKPTTGILTCDFG